jgi:aryl-alcohol dehydrogenase-like predicted oxidoreductase
MSAGLAGRIELGGEISASRLGFGAMRLPGVWGQPEDPREAHRVLRRRSSSASTLSTPRTRMGGRRDRLGQNRYNLSDRASEDVLAVCERAGIAFLPWFPIAAGALAGASELQAVASAHGATAAQVAIAWLLQRSPVLLPIPGTSSIPHLEENTAAAGLRLSAEEVHRLSTGGGT